METEDKKSTLWADIRFGWNYLTTRPGLLGLVIYFAMVNFLLNWSAVLTGPMVLSRHSASTLGTVQMAGGLGMLIGSVLSSTWAGPKRRIPAVIGYIGLAMVGVLVVGLNPSPVFVGAGLFCTLLFIPLASTLAQAVFQSKVEPGLQGRVFSIRSMIARSMMPLAFLIAGPLADRVFGPLMDVNGAWAGTALGQLLGAGAGRGIGLMFVLSAVVGLLVTAWFYFNPHVRNIETEYPDALPATAS